MKNYLRKEELDIPLRNNISHLKHSCISSKSKVFWWCSKHYPSKTKIFKNSKQEIYFYTVFFYL